MMKSEREQLAEKYEQLMLNSSTAYLDVEDMVELVHYYSEINKEGDAIRTLEHALKIHPKNIELRVMHARRLIENGFIDEARKILAQLETPDCRHSFLLKIEIMLYDQVSKEELFEVWNRYIESSEEAKEFSIFAFASLIGPAGYVQEAIEMIEEELVEYPENIYAYVELANNYRELNNDEKALELYNKALDIDPYSILVWNNIGGTYFARKQYDKALEAIEFSLSISPKDKDAMLLKAHCFFALKNFEEAKLHYLNYIELDKSLSDPYLQAGICSYHLRQFKDATELLSEGSVLDGDQIEEQICLYLAISFAETDQLSEALVAINSLLDAFPDKFDYYVYKGSFLMALNRMEEAVDLFLVAIEVDKQKKPVYMAIVSVFFGIKGREVALEKLTKFEELTRGMGSIRIPIGFCYVLSGDFKRCTAFFKEAIESNESDIILMLEGLFQEESFKSLAEEIVAEICPTFLADRQREREND